MNHSPQQPMASGMSLDTTLYRALVSIGSYTVRYPTGEVWVFDELPASYTVSDVRAALLRKLANELGATPEEAASYQLTNIDTHADLIERGVSRIAAHRLLECGATGQAPSYISPDRVVYLFDDRTRQMVGLMHAGVLADQVDQKLIYRALVDDERSGNTWLVLVGAAAINPTDDADDVFAALPGLLAKVWEAPADGIHPIEVQALSEAKAASRFAAAPTAYVWEYQTEGAPYFWPDALTEYSLVQPELCGYLFLVRDGLGGEVPA